MIIFPAVDIKNGNCVRLIKGAFDTAEKVYESPISAALRFAGDGAGYLHIVDLDGSLSGKPENFDVISDIKNNSEMFCEVGGGIRTKEDILRYLNIGIDRVILGTAALDSKFLSECVENFGDRISVGLDAENGIVKTWGWTASSGIDFLTMAKSLEKIGVCHIIYTDISTDGTLSGPNFDHIKVLSENTGLKITASGGIKDKSHIDKLKSMNIYGAICGKSLYSGTLSLSEIL